jgi:hypothetical protein
VAAVSYKTTMKKFIPCTLACLSLLFLTGCFDTKEDFTINPDGSGKVTIESVFAPFQLDMGDDDKKTPDQKLQSAIKDVLDNAKGVAAWRDVSYKQEDDGRVWFKGTAYFADLSQVEFQNLAAMNFTLQKTNGGLVLETQMNKKDDQTKKPAPAKLSDAEMTAKIKESRASYQSSRPMMIGILGAMHQAAVFHLPGAASGVSNFKATPAGDLQISFDGTNMMAAMDALTASDDWWRKQLAAGDNVMQDGVSMDDELNEKLFGQKAPVRAVIAGGGAAKFDYATELAAAKTEFAVLQKKLGADSDSDTTELAPPAQGGEFKSLKIGGVRWIFETDDNNDVRPFNETAGYSLSVVGEFSGSVTEVSDGKVETALALDGSDLLPEDEWNRKINFPRLSKDRTKVVFEINLRPPGPGATGFKEISGTLGYSVAAGTTNVDLGIPEIKAGATGTELGASVVSIKPGFGNNGGQDIELKLHLEPAELISLAAVGADGQETALERRGYFGGNNQYSITFNAKTEIPASSRLVAKMYSQVKQFEVPFKLSNINLSGQPVP